MSGDHDALRYAAEHAAALCTIVKIEGSFSRRLGAQLAVARDGTTAGDMADNCLDAELANQAQAAFAGGNPRVLRYGEGSPFIDFRLPCGSGLEILVDPSPDRAALAGCLAQLDAREPGALKLALPRDAPPGVLAERRYVPPLRLMVLGTMTARLWSLPVVGAEHVVVGEPRGESGRKRMSATSLYDPEGRLVGAAEHVWIAVDPSAFNCSRPCEVRAGS